MEEKADILNCFIYFDINVCMRPPHCSSAHLSECHEVEGSISGTFKGNVIRHFRPDYKILVQFNLKIRQSKFELTRPYIQNGGR